MKYFHMHVLNESLQFLGTKVRKLHYHLILLLRNQGTQKRGVSVNRVFQVNVVALSKHFRDTAVTKLLVVGERPFELSRPKNRKNKLTDFQLVTDLITPTEVRLAISQAVISKRKRFPPNTQGRAEINFLD